MIPRFALAIALLGALPAAAQAQAVDDDSWSPLSLTIEDILGCKIDTRSFNGFASMLDDAREGAAARGWTRVRTDNPLLVLYRLKAPIRVAGYSTQIVALSAGGMLAVLDTPNAEAVARAAGLTPDDYVKTPAKFLGQKEVYRKEGKDDLLGAFVDTHGIAVSTVTDMPGKTLYGCAYRIGFADAP